MIGVISKLIPGANWINLAAGAVVGALLASGPVYLKGRADGAAMAELKPLKQTIEDIRERNHDDAETQRLSDYDLCVRDLGRVPECDTLR